MNQGRGYIGWHKLRWLVLAGAAFLATACRSSTGVLPGASEFGSVVGLWNGAQWSGLGYSVLTGDTLAVYGVRRDERSGTVDVVRTRVVYRGVGEYALDSRATALQHIVGGDAVVGTAAAGALTITAVADDGRRIEGVVHVRSSDPQFDWTFDDGRLSVPVFRSEADIPRLPWGP